MNSRKMICVSCPMGCSLEVKIVEGQVSIEGNKCKKGEQYGLNELREPKRIVTSTIKVRNGSRPLVSVKTDKEILKNMIFDIIKVINSMEISAPVEIGDVLFENILETGVNIVATSNIDRLS